MDYPLGRKALIFLILLLSIFGPLSTDMYLSGLPEMTGDFHTTESILNMSLYMFMFVLAFSILFAGPISDRYGRRISLAVYMGIYTCASILCGLSDDVWMFIILRMVQAFGGGGAMTNAFALVKDFFQGSEMKHVLAILASLGVIGPILAPVLGTVLINLAGWRSTFWAPAVISLICLVMSLYIPRNIPTERNEGTILGTFGRMRSILSDKDFDLFTVMVCIFTASQLAYIAVSSYVYQERFGFTNTEFSLALAIGCILGLVLSNIIRRTRMSNIRVVATVFVLGLISMTMMTFFAYDSWIVFMLAMVPCSSNAITARSFGYGLLMAHHEGDNGVVSSVLNFSTFIFAFCGMLIASSFPSDMFIQGIATVLIISCTVYGVFWIILKSRGYRIRDLV